MRRNLAMKNPIVSVDGLEGSNLRTSDASTGVNDELSSPASPIFVRPVSTSSRGSESRANRT